MKMKIGALEKTRTSTPLREQAPEACASTNSATRALRREGGFDLFLGFCQSDSGSNTDENRIKFGA